jgi:hypothetical protein
MRQDLIPTAENYEEALGRVLDAYGRSGVGLSECLDTDSVALSAGDMRYFGAEYFGRVPSYASFIRYLNRLPEEARDRFNESVAEIESGRTVGEMGGIARGGEYGREEQVKFGMLDKLNRVYERRIDRIDKRRRDRGEGAERGIDMAARIISALSNADLLKVKGNVEAIDAEYKEVAGGE